jgi:hypothetical protein
MSDTSAFGIGEARSLDLAEGEETAVRAGSEVSRLKVTFGDGAEVELTIGPNEVVRIRKGSLPVTLLFEDPGVSVHDPLHAAPES